MTPQAWKRFKNLGWVRPSVSHDEWQMLRIVLPKGATASDYLQQIFHPSDIKPFCFRDTPLLDMLPRNFTIEE